MTMTIVNGDGITGKSCCGAKNRRGEPCGRRDLFPNGRCRLHGGLSTGPRTAAGKAKSAMNRPLVVHGVQGNALIKPEIRSKVLPRVPSPAERQAAWVEYCAKRGVTFSAQRTPEPEPPPNTIRSHVIPVPKLR